MSAIYGADANTHAFMTAKSKRANAKYARIYTRN